MVEIVLCEGKYTYVRDDQSQRALRYGSEWRDLTGDKFVLAMAHRIEELEEDARQAVLHRKTRNDRPY